MLSVAKSDLSFELPNKDAENSIKSLLTRVESFLNKEYGAGFVIPPYLADDILFDPDNFTQLKKKLRDTVSSVRDRWVLFNVTKKSDTKFHNFSISNIGYKAGKKGSKDKPNELMAIYGSDKQRVYNLKYAHSWSRVDGRDANTVLGHMKRMRLWQ